MSTKSKKTSVYSARSFHVINYLVRLSVFSSYVPVTQCYKNFQYRHANVAELVAQQEHQLPLNMTKTQTQTSSCYWLQQGFHFLTFSPL